MIKVYIKAKMFQKLFLFIKKALGKELLWTLRNSRVIICLNTLMTFSTDKGVGMGDVQRLVGKSFSFCEG